MQLHRGTSSPQLRRCCVSIGNFDGVHRGHQTIVRALVDEAQRAGVPSLVFTFEPHPIALLAPDRAPPRLTTLEDKAEYLGNLGVDAVWAYPTNSEVLALTPAEFFQQMLRDQLDAVGLVEGSNFCFGRARTGTIETLRSLCEAASVELRVLDDVCLSGGVVSSTAIRSLIQQGDLASAAAALGRPYRLSGVVGSGQQRGRTLGFPTANLQQVDTLLPADGVYAARCRVQDQMYATAVNVGPNPSFGETVRKLEAHLIGFSGDLYGQPLSIDLLTRVREIQRFSGPAALIAQLQADIAETVRVAGLAAAGASS